MTFHPKVSVIINTDARVKPLATCLESLRYLRYPNFEVVVVAGPTRDGTHELCASYGAAIKFGECPVRNLSQSRNISIELASGDIVAFLDDDSVPEPEWLDDVIPAFLDPHVAVAGGFLHDHTGKAYQWKFGTANRFGDADTSWQRPAAEFNYPLSFNFPHVMANSAFRRSAIVEVGGFDEEYEYYLDETDIICRFVDAGWRVAQLDKGFIHHKFMPSHIRNDSRVLTSWYSLVKNKTYFSLLNGSKHASVDSIIQRAQKLVDEFRGHVRWAVDNKLLPGADLERYETEVESGLRDGLSRGLSAQRKLAINYDLSGGKAPFVKFQSTLPAQEQRCFVFLSKTYPPESVGGIGRYIHQLARSTARLGHQVHVLTAGSGHDRVDFEDNVWVHRIEVKQHEQSFTKPLIGHVPSHIWNYSQTMFYEAKEIAARRKIDAVYAPIWDAEGVAFLDCDDFPLVTSLQTTFKFYLDSNPDKRADSTFMADFVEPMIRLERTLLSNSDGIHSISNAIAKEIETAYGTRLNPKSLWTIPLGLEDWTESNPSQLIDQADKSIKLRFIGRLENRKGIDILFQVTPEILNRYPSVHLDLVGNDKVPGPNGQTWRAYFESNSEFDSVRDRVTFHGEVTDAQLQEFYSTADLIIAPSRFESFGLVHLEGSMYGKPVIGCKIGGMEEVIADGVTGVLAEPGDVESLRQCIIRLLDDAALREKMGHAGRARYLTHFTPDLMARSVVEMLQVISARHERVEAA